MAEAEETKSSDTPEQALLAAARRIAAARPSGGWACHIRLSHLPLQRMKENYSFAVNILRSAVERFLGRVFLFGNSDIVVICWQTRRWQLRSAVASLQPLFESEGRATGRPPAQEPSFATWWDLDQQSGDFLLFAERLASGRGRSDNLVPAPVEKLAIETAEPKGLDPSKFAALVARIKDANLGGAIRRQSICRLHGSGKPQPLFEEVFVSIQELQRLFAPRLDLGLDRWLFRALTEVLDERVLAWLAAAESMKLIARFALNLNLSTFASGAFAKFEARFGAQLRGRMVIEIDKSDLLANLPRFAAVQESLHAHGHLLCIDGLTGPDLAAIDYGRLSADYYKVGWHPDFFAEVGEGRVGLERLAAQASVDKIILSHCSVEEAVKFGQELGLSLFQGWYLDSLLGSFRSSRFKLVANS
jgi:EAL domain-containing protein (putative c-di-GMP-specific phosphodiesterase class I)